MNKNAILIAMSFLSWTGQLWAETSIETKDMGLSKTDIFESPTPKPFTFPDNFPGNGKTLPRAYPNAPPQIPHNIISFKPITKTNNMCLGCHNNPAMIGQKVKGMPTSIPLSHYTDVRNKPNIQGKNLVGARYVCTQCHVPQANVDTLVENDFETFK